MAYNEDKAKFIREYNVAVEKAMSLGVPDFVRVSAEVAFEFYRESFALKVTQVNAKGEAVPPCQIFGRLFLDDADNRIRLRDQPQLPSEMIGITLFEWQNFNSLKLDEWNMAVNDTWVLAGVNSLQDFYPASLVDEKNIIDNRFIPPLTIMGRELVGLTLAGYQEASGHPALGKAYVHGNRKKAEDLSLVDYDEGVSQLKNVGDAKAFFKKAGFVIG